jgi:hypothetical protein
MNRLEDLVWMLAPFAIPLYAILGGTILAVVKIRGHQRLEELARLERIATLERGFLPSTPRNTSSTAA